MIGNHHSAAKAFRRSGCEPLRVVAPHKFTGNAGSALLPSVMAGSCRFVFIEEPDPDECQPYAMQFWTQCISFLNASCLAGIPFAVQLRDAKLGKSRASSVQRQQLFADGRTFASKHHWCHWKINKHGRMGDAVTAFVSNFQIADSLCGCPSGRPHGDLQLSRRDRDSFRLFNEFSMRMLVVLTASAGLPPIVGELATSHSSAVGSGLSSDNSESQAPTLGPLNIPDSQGIRPATSCQMDAQQMQLTFKETETAAFPTDSKERERDRKNALKEQGVDVKALVKKQKKYVEEHYDDCGDDLTSITDNEMPLLVDSDSSTIAFNNSSDEADESSSSEDDFIDQLELFSLFGNRDNPDDFPLPSTVVRPDSIDHAVSLLASAGEGLDMCEFCGGEQRTTRMAVRRRLSTGKNFDLVCNIDLNDPKEQNKALRYLNANNVLVAVMSPTCAPFGPLSHLNKAAQPEAWQRSYENAAPHGRFCGLVALTQLKHGRHFINEQPDPSNLYKEHPWPTVLSTKGVVSVRWDRCQTGLVVKGLPAKKASRMVASHPLLIAPFENKICKHRHQHQNLLNDRAKLGQTWTWEESKLVASGISALKRFVEKASAFPNIAVGPDASAAAASAAPAGASASASSSTAECKACRRGWWKHSHSHSRVRGVCRYPDVETQTMKCPGCHDDQPRHHKDHNNVLGECRWATATYRAYAPRPKRKVRQNQAAIPRERARADPTTDMRPDKDAEADESIGDARASASTEGQEESGDSAPSGAVRGRPPGTTDSEPRTRRTWSETGTGPEHPLNWNGFDVGRTIRSIITSSEPAKRRLLRKLHVRWWHAPAATMKRLLQQAGTDDSVSAIIDEVVDTCSVCRTWARPLPESVASTSVAEKFNAQVECDLVFYKTFVIFHCIDRCTRWHATMLLPNDHPTCEQCEEALQRTWLSSHGPMKEFIVDGESAIARAMHMAAFFDRNSISFKLRAPHQHARFIERRGALLKETLRRIDTQLESEGLSDVPFISRLAEATYAGNALIAVNGSTPYNAVYGRVPNLLPDMVAHPESTEVIEGPLRYSHRLREVAIQKMVEGTAAARVGRALQTRTLPTVQPGEYKVGDLVDFHRPAARKDLPEWNGPATLVDVSQVPSGTMGLRWHGQNFPSIRLGNIRPHEGFLVFFEQSEGRMLQHPAASAAEIIKQTIEGLGPNKPLLLGHAPLSDGVSRTAKANPYYRQTLAALHHYAEVGLRLDGFTTFRLGLGVAKIPGLTGFLQSVIIWWLADTPYVTYIHECDGQQEINLREIIGSKWPDARFIQVLFPSESVELSKPAEAGAGSSDPAPPRPPRTNPSGLETIMEGNESEVASTAPTEDSFLVADDEELIAATREAVWHILNDDDQISLLARSGCLIPDRAEYISREPPCQLPSRPTPVVEHYHNVCACLRAGLSPEDVSFLNLEEDNLDYVAIDFPGDTAKVLDLEGASATSGDIVSLRFYFNQTKKAVIERDTDLLTPAETLEHREEVASAMLQELKTWQKYKCFSRRARSGAQNVIDCRWVLKWKYVEVNGKSVRTIRARLTVRGFKDRQAADLDTYSGTAQRYAQRLVVSEAVRRGWDLATADIEKAFLQGVTYDELAELTGEPKREVNFMLPMSCVPLLRKLPGFENFDASSEVCHCDKPGTGLVDAPRAFSLKLGMVTRNKCGMLPTSVDSELCLCHRSGRLVGLVAKHVDDLKLAGERQWIEEVCKILEATFGPLKLVWNEFTNCGVRHLQDKVTKEITLDQTEYIAALKPIEHVDLVKASSEALATDTVQELYRSLLGAVAFCSLTRVDAAVFIVALQRQSGKATNLHVRRLNVLTRWLQKNPRKLRYPRFRSNEQHMLVVSDAAFRKEDDDGHSLKGAAFLRLDGSSDPWGRPNLQDFVRRPIHVIDYYSRKVRHVNRSTFGAELHAACDAGDMSMLLVQLLHEFEHGCCNATIARQLRETGGWKVQLVLAIDAMSVFAGVTASAVKIPAEKALWAHVQYMRELLDTGVIKHLVWFDTRDMIADGLTKGAVNRLALHHMMEGHLTLAHLFKSWKPKIVQSKI